MGWEKRDNDWLGEHSRESDGENEWGMDGGRRRRGEINMALIVSSAPLPSLDQPFITPPQSVQRRHFGKWGLPLTPSAKTAATYLGVCLIQRGRQIVYVCVRLCVDVQVSECLHDTQRRLFEDEFVSLPDGRKKEKKSNTYFIFFSCGATPSISCGKSNGKLSASAFCMMLTLICTLVWKASRHHVEN